ncbi:MAG: hypothetical protein HKK67_07270 [Chlorobiaceae bacterium]|nr:hypothetical protein [Chlorobiaceae bacterium]
MKESETLELPGVATMLETGTPQAIALRKENVIESELKAIELNYRGLKIAGIDDTSGIKIVADARKYCKKLRTTAERICKAGREDAIQEQKRWLQVEKYVVDRIKSVETELSTEENRIEKLREEGRQEAARRAKAEDDRLQGICNEFARLGKLKAKDEIRYMEPGIIEALLAAARNEKADKEAAAQKLVDEKRAADATIAELQRQIAAMQTQMQAKNAQPAATTAATPTLTKPQQPNGNQPGTPCERILAYTVRMHENNGHHKAAAQGTSLPFPLPLPGLNGKAAPAAQAAAAPAGPAAVADPDAELLKADKAALLTFANQINILKKYLPVASTKKAAELHELIASQIEKFAQFVTKKAEEL